MKILIDSREKLPLTFPYKDVTTERYKLGEGDYGCMFKDGYIPPIRFERKSKGDLFSTMGQGYQRFRKELERAIADELRLVLIIEEPYREVLKGYYYTNRHGRKVKSKITGKTMIKKLNTLWIKYDMVPIFCEDRKEMSRRICDFYSAIGRVAKYNK